MSKLTEKQFNEMGFTHEDYNQLKDRIEELQRKYELLVDHVKSDMCDPNCYCSHCDKLRALLGDDDA